MPTYEYQCRKCGRQFSLAMSMADYEKRKVDCPKCKSRDVKRVVQSVFVTTSRKS